MSARLVSRGGKIRGEFKVGEEATLGRSSKNSVVLKPELLSNRHARIWRDGERGCYMLEDLGSSNGTRLDGEPVKRPEPLGHLHVITLAEHYELIFVDAPRVDGRHAGESPRIEAVARAIASDVSESTRIEELSLPLPGFGGKGGGGKGVGREMEESRERTMLEKLPIPLPGFLSQGHDAAASEAEGSADEPSPPAQTILQPMPKGPTGPRPTLDLKDAISTGTESPKPPPEAFSDTFFLEIITDSGPVRHRLQEGDNLVGRDPRANIRPTSPEVSRRHALFQVSPGRLVVRDLGSRNQTFVDHRPIGEDVELVPGQKVRFGALEARVLTGDDWEEEG